MSKLFQPRFGIIALLVGVVLLTTACDRLSLPPLNGAGNTPVPTPGAIPTLPPVVTDFSPQSGEETRQDWEITLRFSQPMDRGSVEQALQITPAVEGTPDWPDDQTLVFRPRKALPAATRYQVLVGTGARSQAGLAMPSEVNFAFSTQGPLAVAYLSPENEATGLRVDIPVLLSFNRPVVPINCSGKKAGDDPNCPILPLSFTPAVMGAGSWVNSSIYRFDPQPGWAAGVTYNGTLPASVQAMDGAALETPLAWSFTTAVPKVLGVTPEDKMLDVPLDASIRVIFNTAMNREASGSAFAVRTAAGVPVPGSITWEDNGAVLVFTPTQKLELATQYVVRVGERARALTSAPLESAVEWSFTTVPYPQPVVIYPAEGARSVMVQDPVRIRFEGLISETTLAAHLLITPTVPEDSLYSYWDGATYNLSWSKEPRTEYCITMLPGVLDVYGNETQERLDACFTTGDLRSLLGPVTELDPITLDAADSSRFYFMARNVARAEFTLSELGEKQFLPYDGGDGSSVRNWTVRFEGEANQVFVEPIELTAKGDNLPTGYYRLSWEGREDWWRTSMRFAVVDRHLTLKMTTDEVLVWVTDLRTAEPATGAEVRLVDEKGVLLGAGTTDSDGVARIRISERENLWDRLAAIVGTPGEPGFGITMSDWNAQASPWNFDVTVNYGPFIPYNVYLHSDRPIYRPGQEVLFRGLVRRDTDDERYALPDADLEVSVTLRDSNWEAVYSTTLSLNEMGAFDGRIRLLDDAAIGQYSLEVRLPETDQNWTIPLSVAAYRKPEFEVKVTPEQSDLLQGEKLRALVEAAYYFGGPAGQAKVHWTVLAEPYAFEPDIPEWWNWNAAPGESWYWGEPVKVAEGDATTDAQGRYLVELPAKLQALPDQTRVGPQRWTVEVQVTDESGLPVVGRGTVNIHQGRFYLGVRPKSGVAVADQRSDIELLALDWAGEPVPNQTVEVQLVQRAWHRVDSDQPLISPSWEYSDTLVTTTTVKTSAEGRGKLSLTPPRSGSYVVVARAVDEAGKQVYGETFLWVSGPESAAWRLPEGQVQPVPDARQYRAGQTARILLPTPFKAPFQVLMTVERHGILSVERFTASEPNPVVELPITDAYIPNFYVSFVVIKGVDADQAVPDVRIGMVELAVEPVTQTLTVEVIPDRLSVYNPGDPVTLTVRTLDSAGATVDAEVGLAVVDKAVLALARPNSGSLLEGFYASRPLSVITGDSMLVLFNRVTADLEALSGRAEQLAEAMDRGGMGGGGGDGAALPSEVRQEFPDTAYWAAHLRTGATGEAQVSFPLPDSLTTWVVDGRAVTAQTQVGQATAELVVSKPLLVRPVTPRFFVAGDHAEVAAVVHNNTAVELEAAVGLEVTGVNRIGDAEQKVTLPAGGRARVSWAVEIPEGDVSQAQLIFSVKGGEYEDSAVPPFAREPGGTLPIYHYESPEVMASGGQLEGAGSRWEAVLVPPQTSSSGDLTVRIEPSLAAGMTPALTALEGYPYESTESLVSRFLPNVQSYRALRELKLEDAALEAKLQLQVADTLDRLYSRQHADGGWGWWRETESQPLVSAYVAFGMVRARQAGFPLREESLQRAMNYLSETLKQAADENRLSSVHSFILLVLTQGNASWPEGTAAALYAVRDSIGGTGRAYLALALGLKDAADPRVKTLLAGLRAEASITATGAHWMDSNAATWATDTRATAVMVETLIHLAPDDPLLPQAVRWLVVARRGSLWESPQETAWALIGLSDYLATTGELKGEYSWGVAVNGSGIRSGVVNSETLRTSTEVLIPLTNLLSGQINALEIARGEGEGRLYYTTYLRSYYPAASVAAESRGIDVRREYCQVSAEPKTGEMVPPPCVPVTRVRPGDLVEVHLTVTLPEDRYYLSVEDSYPAGMEPVNPTLLTETSQVSEPEAEKIVDSEGMPVSGFRWWEGAFDHRELRDERAVFFATSIRAGTYQLRYTLRAAIPGEYRVLPTVAYETYFPEVWGRSNGTTFRVEAP